MSEVERAADRARPATLDEGGVDDALRAALEEEERLQRRKLLLAGGAVGLLIAATVRITLALRAPGRAPGVAAMLLDGALVTGALAAAGYALMVARRADRGLARLQEHIATLRMIRAALEHESGLPVLVVERPALTDAKGSAARERAVASPAPRGARSPGGRKPTGVLGLALTGAFVAAVALVLLRLGAASPPAARHRWTFVDEVADPAALGFRMSEVAAGAWQLAHHADATGARALVNLAGAPGAEPATAVVDDPSPRDLQIITRCKVSPDLPEQACGVVFRYRDEGNHYVARVDALGGAVTLGAVINGSERVLERAEVAAGASTWQELQVLARADRFVVELNGRRVIEVHDPTHAHAGAVGLWAPASCVAYFDELAVQPLASSPHPGELLPLLLGKKRRTAL